MGRMNYPAKGQRKFGMLQIAEYLRYKQGLDGLYCLPRSDGGIGDLMTQNKVLQGIGNA